MAALFSDTIRKIRSFGVVPVVALEEAEQAAPLAKAFLEGGLGIIEITFRTDAAADAIRRVRDDAPDMFTGAGTVLSVDQVKAAVDAGAQFIVSPGFNESVVDYCVSQKIPITPGINNPTGVEMALQRGLSVVKFFPAELSGGTAMIKALSGPYRKVGFIPTGGVKPENLKTYLSIPSVVACGGTWLAPKEALAKGDFKKITALTAEAMEIVRRAGGIGEIPV
jgi:2-dehydro-3-deoxyphosphogluconate aldolase / (4S)-4-hydroxy-2-oxoglutarate aldolase